MNSRIHRRMLALVLLNCALVTKLQAGGSGLNTVVIFNQTSSNSCALGNYYCERRQVPPQNVLYICWSGGNTLWTSNDFQASLVSPLLTMLADRQLTNQIDYLVLSMDIPFQTSFGSAVNSTTSALFYGSRLGNGTDPFSTTNSYAASEAVFRQARPVGAPGYSFLTTMITADTLAEAEALVDQGVASDGAFPEQPVILAKSSDTQRNIRYTFFDNAIFNVNILGNSSILRTNSDSVSWQGGCLGVETGLAQFSIPPNTFVPGAMADSLTSFGGIIFGDNSQTSLLAFINAGAAGSYGTVVEPGLNTQDFPNPQDYFYQARGFSLAESYYQSISVPYLGLTVAEPLAAPFALSARGKWQTNLVNTVLTGTTNLSVNFYAHDANHPLQQVDLFVDGAYYCTLTNLAPRPGNQLNAALNGYPITYSVPTNSTINSIAAGLAALINSPSATNATQIKALIHGDRIELQSIAANPATTPFYVACGTSQTTSNIYYSVNYLPVSTPPLMIAGRLTKNGAFTMGLGIPTTMPYVVLASTNLLSWQPVFTSSMPGLINYVDSDATNYSARFYRMTWPDADQLPEFSGAKFVGTHTFQMHVDSVPGLAWATQVSTNLVNWVSISTNQAGGAMDYIDDAATNPAGQYYRVWRVPPLPPTTNFIMTQNTTLISVAGASQPYTVEFSTNQGQTTVLATNFNIGEIQTSAGSALGNADSLTTFLTASQPAFLASGAFGRQQYMVLSNSLLSANSWIKFTFTKTNGQTVVVAVTNQSPSDPVTLARQEFDAINTNTALQGTDGVWAGDYSVNGIGTTSFNLYARSPGLQAAAIQVIPTTKTVIMLPPSGYTLKKNLSDLEPRNHLYVTTGATALSVNFTFDTTTLPDGYHQLTAVAYEGSNVRTETQVTVPVSVQNSPLSATMTLLDLTNQSPAQGTYHIQVDANTNTVSFITLFSNGGALGTATNTPTAVFQVNGANLGAGLLPFYALVQTSDGLAYRTQMQSVRLQ